MKHFHIFLLATCAGALICASLIAADYQPKSDDFRIVAGKLYNIRLSTNWTDLPRSASSSLEVVQVLPEGVVFQRFWYHDIRGPQALPGSATAGRIVGTEKQYGEKSLVKNHPQKSSLTTGNAVHSQMRVMLLGVFQYGSDTIEAFDYGLPNTAENRRTLKQ